MKLSRELDENTKANAIIKLKRAMKENKNQRMHERYQILIMVLNGLEYKEISMLTGRSTATISNYVKAYRQGGIAGLHMNHSTGRPKKLTKEQEQQVYNTIVNNTPKDVGFPNNMNWTSPIIRTWIKNEFGVTYSDRGTRALLYRLNLSYTAPTYTLKKADPAKQELFRLQFEDLKKNS
jgi:transposase